jgi:hypothetical protein
MICRTRTWQLFLLLVTAFLLDGCSSLPNDEAGNTAPREQRVQREARLQSTWKGQSYHALVEAYGAPKMVMSVPSPRPVPTSIVVYGVIDNMTNCIDSFTVTGQVQNIEDMTVMDYFCR